MSSTLGYQGAPVRTRAQTLAYMRELQKVMDSRSDQLAYLQAYWQILSRVFRCNERDMLKSIEERQTFAYHNRPTAKACKLFWERFWTKPGASVRLTVARLSANQIREMLQTTARRQRQQRQKYAEAKKSLRTLDAGAGPG